MSKKDIQEEMEKATKELQEQLKNFNFEDFQMDTLLLKEFKYSLSDFDSNICTAVQGEINSPMATMGFPLLFNHDISYAFQRS